MVSKWQAASIEIKTQRQHGSFGPSHDHHSNPQKLRLESGKKSKSSAKNESKIAIPQETVEGPCISTTPQDLTSVPSSDTKELENAIEASVAATSRGNPEEDQLVERAIRASVLELQSASYKEDDDEAIKRAIQASIAEAKRSRPASKAELEDTSEHDRQLEESLQQSLQQTRSMAHSEVACGHDDFDDSGIESEDGDNLHTDGNTGTSRKADEDLERAIELSKKTHEHHMMELGNQKSEEEVVLNYIMKQSVLEEEHKRNIAKLNNTRLNAHNLPPKKFKE